VNHVGEPALDPDELGPVFLTVFLQPVGVDETRRILVGLREDSRQKVRRGRSCVLRVKAMDKPILRALMLGIRRAVWHSRFTKQPSSNEERSEKTWKKTCLEIAVPSRRWEFVGVRGTPIARANPDQLLPSSSLLRIPAALAGVLIRLSQEVCSMPPRSSAVPGVVRLHPD